jgi:hypothetical protein
MSISGYIIEKWLLFFLFYWTIYIYSLPLLFLLFWFWLTYVDRVHIRVKSKNIGLFIQNKIQEKISPAKIRLVTKYCYKQLNALGEIIAGLSDGLLNSDSSIEVKYLQNNNSQTLISNYNYNVRNKEIQTTSKFLLDCGINTDVIEIKEIKENGQEEINNLEKKLVMSSDSSSSSSSEKILPPRKIFAVGKKNHLDTEILKNDIEADNKNIIFQKNKRITIRKK